MQSIHLSHDIWSKPRRNFAVCPQWKQYHKVIYDSHVGCKRRRPPIDFSVAVSVPGVGIWAEELATELETSS